MNYLPANKPWGIGLGLRQLDGWICNALDNELCLLWLGILPEPQVRRARVPEASQSRETTGWHIAEARLSVEVLWFCWFSPNNGLHPSDCWGPPKRGESIVAMETKRQKSVGLCIKFCLCLLTLSSLPETSWSLFALGWACTGSPGKFYSVITKFDLVVDLNGSCSSFIFYLYLLSSERCTDSNVALLYDYHLILEIVFQGVNLQGDTFFFFF